MSEIVWTSESESFEPSDWEADTFEDLSEDVDRVYGMCTHCGAVEVRLILPISGYRDFSDIGESANYPTGYGCEVCS